MSEFLRFQVEEKVNQEIMKFFDNTAEEKIKQHVQAHLNKSLQQIVTKACGFTYYGDIENAFVKKKIHELVSPLLEQYFETDEFKQEIEEGFKTGKQNLQNKVREEIKKQTKDIIQNRVRSQIAQRLTAHADTYVETAFKKLDSAHRKLQQIGATTNGE